VQDVRSVSSLEQGHGYYFRFQKESVTPDTQSQFPIQHDARLMTNEMFKQDQVANATGPYIYEYLGQLDSRTDH
jgi:hypothetical protein